MQETLVQQLKLAIEKGNLDLLSDQLYLHPELLNMKCISGFTPLGYAMLTEGTQAADVIECLLNNKASPFVVTPTCQTLFTLNKGFSPQELKIIANNASLYLESNNIGRDVLIEGMEYLIPYLAKEDFLDLPKYIQKECNAAYKKRAYALEKQEKLRISNPLHGLHRHYDRTSTCPYNALKRATFCQNSAERDRINTIIDTLKNYHDPFIDRIVHIAALDTRAIAARLKIFVADGENIAPLTFNKREDKNSYGETSYYQKSILVSGERKDTDIVCTLIHELTHYAMFAVYRNDANPYPQEKPHSCKDKEHLPYSPKQTRARSFEHRQAKTKRKLYEFPYSNTRQTPDVKERLFTSVKDNYSKDDHHAEYIARLAELYVKRQQYPQYKKEYNTLIRPLRTYKHEILMKDMENYITAQNSPFTIEAKQKACAK